MRSSPQTVPNIFCAILSFYGALGWVPTIFSKSSMSWLDLSWNVDIIWYANHPKRTRFDENIKSTWICGRSTWNFIFTISWLDLSWNLDIIPYLERPKRSRFDENRKSTWILKIHVELLKNTKSSWKCQWHGHKISGRSVVCKATKKQLKIIIQNNKAKITAFFFLSAISKGS